MMIPNTFVLLSLLVKDLENFNTFAEINKIAESNLRTGRIAVLAERNSLAAVELSKAEVNR